MVSFAARFSSRIEQSNGLGLGNAMGESLKAEVPLGRYLLLNMVCCSCNGKCEDRILSLPL